MKNKILALSFSLLAFSSSEALAVTAGPDGYVNAYADLSWEDLAVTGGITAYDSYSYSSAKTADYYDIALQATKVYQYSPASPVSFAQSIIPVGLLEAAKSVGETTATSIISGSTVQLLQGYYGAYSAEARSQQGLAYQVTSTGTVTFSIPYYLDVLVEDSYGDNTAEANTRAWSWLSLWSGNKWSVIDSTFSEALSGSGFLSISYEAAAGSFLRFEAGADSRAQLLNPVPIPPSVLMLLTGCTSLFFLKRRKS